jgi:hypothetical protein
MLLKLKTWCSRFWSKNFSFIWSNDYFPFEENKYQSKFIEIQKDDTEIGIKSFALLLFFISTSNFEVWTPLFELSGQQLIFQRKHLDCLIKCWPSRKIHAIHVRENIISRKISLYFILIFASYDEIFWMSTFSLIPFASFFI